MKKNILITLICLTLMLAFNIGLALSSVSFTASDTKTIVFEDKNLYNVVKGNPLIVSSNDDELSVEIEQRSIEYLTSLTCSSEAITSLKGIENFKNLESLDIDNNKGLTDLSVLSELTNLESLSIEGLGINNIDIVESLPNLKKLYISNNNVTDIEALKNLTNLEILYLDDNLITNIDVLQNLVNLEKLNIEGNKITDLSSLENLINLEELKFRDNLLDQSDVKEINKLINNLDNLDYIVGGINVIEDTFVLPDIFMDDESTFSHDCDLSEDKTEMLFWDDETECYVDIEEGKYENSTMYVSKVTEEFLSSQIKESKSLSSNTQTKNLVIFIISTVFVIALISTCIFLIKKGNVSKKVLVGLIVFILIFLVLSVYFGIKSFDKNTETIINESADSDDNSEEKGEAININGYDVYIGFTTYDDFVNNTKFNETERKKSNNTYGVNFTSYNSDGYSTLEVIVKNNIIQAIFIGYDDLKFDSTHTTFVLPGEITIGDNISKIIEYYGEARQSSLTYVYFNTNIGAETNMQITVDKDTNKIQHIYVGLTY